MFNKLVERQGDKRSQQRWRADTVSFCVRACWLADWAPRWRHGEQGLGSGVDARRADDSRSAKAWGRALVPSHSRGVPEAMGLCGAIAHSRVCRGGLMRTVVAKEGERGWFLGKR